MATMMTQSFQASRVDAWLIRLAILTSAVGAAVAILAASSRQNDYKPGDRFAAVAGLDLTQSSATLVMFLNTNCGASVRTTEVLARIARRPRTFRVVVIGYEAQELLTPFVQSVAIDSDSVLTARVGSIRFATVPQVALLDQNGTVNAVWAGFEDITGMEEKILVAARELRPSRFP